MSAAQRIRSFLAGLFLIGLTVVMFVDPDDGFSIVATILSVSLIAFGVRELFYYFTMARFMVGGKSALYIGVIMLDAGVFALTLSDMPKLYIVLYLLIIHAFSGAVDVMRSTEARRLGAASWRLNLLSGVVNIAISVVCVIFLRSPHMIVYIYASGLAYSAVFRIVNACRKTAVVYIQ